jgi:hypothetical protein
VIKGQIFELVALLHVNLMHNQQYDFIFSDSAMAPAVLMVAAPFMLDA